MRNTLVSWPQEFSADWLPIHRSTRKSCRWVAQQTNDASAWVTTFLPNGHVLFRSETSVRMVGIRRCRLDWATKPFLIPWSEYTILHWGFSTTLGSCSHFVLDFAWVWSMGCYISCGFWGIDGAVVICDQGSSCCPCSHPLVCFP